ncbi:O-antigen polymerase [Pseudomonas sp. NFACC42-2]|uniref:O-antigen polymerase n=1 Tax=Pseudomonas sp. NFACC42-2 TaxID=1566193 RepID=UPI0008F3A63E|nr:O-antigen polymerase [Pseudomonas sp. NFACC42-2]SFS28959.1 oligosaccharide repeat unit polymerase [Pseudomonas sp. NFACC42-2]
MIFIPVLVVGWLLVVYQLVNKLKVGVVSYLIFIYFCSLFCSAILYFCFGYDERYMLQLEPLIYFSISLSLLLLGFFRFRDFRFKVIVLNNIKTIKFIEWAIVPFTFGAIVFFLSHALTMLSGDIEANRNAVAAGQVNYLSEMGLINSIFSLVSNLFVLNMLFAFLNLTEAYPGASVYRSLVHLVLSTVYIFYIMAYVGRDGVVFWFMSLCFFYLLFRGFIVNRKLKFLKRMAMMLTIPAFIIFMVISAQRFGGDNRGGILIALLDYAGQQVLNFNDHYLVNPPLANGAISFAPLVSLSSYLFGADSIPFNKEAWNKVFLDEGVAPWVFTTLIGSFMYDFGRIGGLIVISLLSCLVCWVLRDIKKHGVIKFSDLILFILLFQVSSWGVFYYRQYSSFFYILSLLLMVAVYKFSGRTRRVFIRKLDDLNE